MKKVLGKALHTIRRKMLCCKEPCLHQHGVQQAFRKVRNSCSVQLVKAKARLVVGNY